MGCLFAIVDAFAMVLKAFIGFGWVLFKFMLCLSIVAVLAFVLWIFLLL